MLAFRFRNPHFFVIYYFVGVVIFSSPITNAHEVTKFLSPVLCRKRERKRKNWKLERNETPNIQVVNFQFEQMLTIFSYRKFFLLISVTYKTLHLASDLKEKQRVRFFDQGIRKLSKFSEQLNLLNEEKLISLLNAAEIRFEKRGRSSQKPNSMSEFFSYALKLLKGRYYE